MRKKPEGRKKFQLLSLPLEMATSLCSPLGKGCNIACPMNERGPQQQAEVSPALELWLPSAAELGQSCPPGGMLQLSVSSLCAAYWQGLLQAAAVSPAVKQAGPHPGEKSPACRVLPSCILTYSVVLNSGCGHGPNPKKGTAQVLLNRLLFIGSLAYTYATQSLCKVCCSGWDTYSPRSRGWTAMESQL